MGGIRPALYLGQKVQILTSSGIVNGVVGVNRSLLKNKSLEATDLFILKVTNVGGIRVPLYLGQKVQILTSSGIVNGVVGVNRSLLKNKSLEATDLFIDLGASSKEEALKVVKPGDYVVAATDYCELMNDCISGRALDNRLGAFIVIEALRRAKELGARVGIYSATTVGDCDERKN